MSDVLNINGACRVLGSLLREDARPVCKRTLERYRKEGLPHIKFRGAVVFREVDLRKWVESKRVGVMV